MAATRNDLLRFLDDAWEQASAENGVRTLREVMRSYEKGVAELVSQGSISTVSKSSSSHTYALASAGTITPLEIARGWRDLITLHDAAKASLEEHSDADPTEKQIYGEIKLRLEQPANERGHDFSELRC